MRDPNGRYPISHAEPGSGGWAVPSCAMSSTDFETTGHRLTGWGRTAPSVAQVLSTPDVDVIAKAVAHAADSGVPQTNAV